MAERTAQNYEDWRSDAITQAAAAWVLSCVFVRFLEDNRLIDPPQIAVPASGSSGPGTSRNFPRPSAAAQRARLPASLFDELARLRAPRRFRGAQPDPRAAQLALRRRGRGTAGVLPEDRRQLGRASCSTTSLTQPGTRGSWATSIRTCPRRLARNTPCCRRPSSSRSSFWTGPWSRPWTSSAGSRKSARQRTRSARHQPKDRSGIYGAVPA